MLEGRAVDRASPDVELAMRFIRVAALCQDQEYAAAETELDALVEQAPRVSQHSWRYKGSRAAVNRLKDPDVKQFLQKLLTHSESLGKTGNPEELRRLLHKVRDAHTH